MRKPEGLKNIEFVGVDISDDIKSALIKHTKTIYKFKQLKPNIKFVLHTDMEEDNGMGLIVTVLVNVCKIIFGTLFLQLVLVTIHSLALGSSSCEFTLVSKFLLAVQLSLVSFI